MTWLVRLIAGHWVALLSTKLIIAGAVAGLGWVYHKGAAHERAHIAAQSLRLQENNATVRERVDESVLDSIRAGTVFDGLSDYFRD